MPFRVAPEFVPPSINPTAAPDAARITTRTGRLSVNKDADGSYLVNFFDGTSYGTDLRFAPAAARAALAGIMAAADKYPDGVEAAVVATGEFQVGLGYARAMLLPTQFVVGAVLPRMQRPSNAYLERLARDPAL